MSLKSANKIETNKYELEISVDGDKFMAEVDKAYKKNIKKINVPGFRKGKAPKHVVEKLYGEGVFYEDAVNALYPSEYDEAVKEAKIEPVDRADIEVVKVGKDGFDFKAKVIVKPDVELGQYKGLKAARKSAQVVEKDIDGELKKLQERNARILTVEDRPAKKGDTAVLDFEGFIDGKAFEGGKAEKYSLELGSGSFIPGFEEQVEGHSIDEEFDINVKFPDDYNAKDLAGKDATFKIKLLELKEKELPALDDEFAKDISEKDTLAEVKEDIRKKLEESKKRFADENVEDQLIDKIVEGMKVEVPDVMIEHSIDDMVKDFDYRLHTQGLDLDGYLHYTKSTLEEFRKTFKNQAEHNVKTRLALDKIAQVENLMADEKELEEEYEKLAKNYQVDVEKAKTAFAKENVEQDLKMQKAIDLVKNSAEITDEKPESEKKASKKSEKKSGK